MRTPLRPVTAEEIESFERDGVTRGMEGPVEEALRVTRTTAELTGAHARTLHGASGNRSATERRRAISVRYCGDDARCFLREGAPRKPHRRKVRDGDVLDSEDCPVVFRDDGPPR